MTPPQEASVASASDAAPQTTSEQAAERSDLIAEAAEIFDLDAALAKINAALGDKADAREVRLFCLTPLFMAAATLAHAEGHDGLFDPSVDVKITREDVAHIVQLCMNNAHDDAVLRDLFPQRPFAAAPRAQEALR